MGNSPRPGCTCGCACTRSAPVPTAAPGTRSASQTACPCLRDVCDPRLLRLSVQEPGDGGSRQPRSQSEPGNSGTVTASTIAPSSTTAPTSAGRNIYYT